MQLKELVSDFASALKAVDSRHPTGGDPRFKPGVGPLTEKEVTTAIICELRAQGLGAYRDCASRGYPAPSRATCDLVIPTEWAIELKLARPFGDNGKPAERWSENLLYPYPGNTSSIGDCLKLLGSSFTERKAIVVIGYEHSPPQIPLEPAVHGFELLARDVLRIHLSDRVEMLITDLVHPSHQRATIYAWEVLGALSSSA